MDESSRDGQKWTVERWSQADTGEQTRTKSVRTGQTDQKTNGVVHRTQKFTFFGKNKSPANHNMCVMRIVQKTTIGEKTIIVKKMTIV